MHFVDIIIHLIDLFIINILIFNFLYINKKMNIFLLLNFLFNDKS